MTVRLKNTWSKAVEPFAPLGDPVLLYSCGPTVYSYAHIGNFRSFLLGDLLRRTLERRGYRVRHVMNITDVGHMTQDHLADGTGEDKLAVAARQLGWDPYQVARHYEDAFAADARALGLRNYQGAEAGDPALHPRATRYVPEMLAMIQRLIEFGYAYVDGAGQVYFEIARFPEYGRLSGKVIDELEAGARVEVRAEKRDPRDFALWKCDDKHLMQWDPHGPDGWPAEDWARLRALVPGGVDAGVGRGFPGWHIECSAMAKACLGPVIDLHTGGEDNVFPHHECEIAQSFAAAGEGARLPFARFWVHGRHLLVDGRKMSKRDGTFFTVRDLLDPRAAGRLALTDPLAGLGFAGGRVPAAVLRYALLSTPFGLPLNFSFDLLALARTAVLRLQSRHDRLREAVAAGAPSGPQADQARAAVARGCAAFDAALDDDLDVAGALAAAGALVGELNLLELGAAEAGEALRALEGLDDVIGVLDRGRRAGLLGKAELVARRGAAPVDAATLAAAELDADLIERALVERDAAKAGKDFARADGLRRALQERGVAVEDTPNGVRWTLP